MSTLSAACQPPQSFVTRARLQPGRKRRVAHPNLWDADCPPPWVPKLRLGGSRNPSPTTDRVPLPATRLSTTEYRSGPRACRQLFSNDSVNNRPNLRSCQCRLSNLDTDAGRTALRLQIISTLSRTMDLCPNSSRTVPSRPRLQTPRAAARRLRAQSAGAAPRFPLRTGHSHKKCPKTPQLGCIFQACTTESTRYAFPTKKTENMPQFWCIFRAVFSTF